MTKEAEVYQAGRRDDDVKIALFDALMRLLSAKEFESITVSELCREACVSRMTFYRCYATKEALLLEHVDHLFASYVRDVVRTQELSRRTLALGFCEYWKGNRAFLEVLIERGLSHFLLDKFTQYLGVMFGTMLFSKGRESVSPHELSYHAGGLYLVLINWARQGFAETPESMAAIIDRLASAYTVGHVS